MIPKKILKNLKEMIKQKIGSMTLIDFAFSVNHLKLSEIDNFLHTNYLNILNPPD